jgi:pSer/pThr/pTyr-binding forkhead associated (FHA) protein
MPAHLLSLADGPSILVDKPILLFGRHEECDVQLNSKKVSRRHCCLAQVNDYLVIRDLGSTNGVRINGERVKEGKLLPGDELQIGNFKYQICGDGPAPAEPASALEPYKPVQPVEDGED